MYKSHHSRTCKHFTLSFDILSLDLLFSHFHAGIQCDKEKVRRVHTVLCLIELLLHILLQYTHFVWDIFIMDIQHHLVQKHSIKCSLFKVRVWWKCNGVPYKIFWVYSFLIIFVFINFIYRERNVLEIRTECVNSLVSRFARKFLCKFLLQFSSCLAAQQL